MACFNGTILSEELGMETGLTVILPHDLPSAEMPCKVIYLFHGLAQNATSWLRNSNIERYACEHGMAVVMPEVQRGFYCDMAMGLKYYSYVARELPELCGKMFNISQKREDSFVAGLSMGGYGAVRCALSCPERFSACASFSGVLDFNYVLSSDFAEREREQLMGILGTELEVAPENDNYALGRAIAELPAAQKPRFYLACGEQDFLREVNQGFQAFLKEQSFELLYEEWPGVHDWKFWDVAIQRAIKFLSGHKLSCNDIGSCIMD